MNKWKMRSLKSKIMLLFILSASVVLILQLGIFQRWISTIIMDKSNAYFEETVHQIGKRVDLQIKQFDTMALAVSGNQVLKNYLRDINRHQINYTIAKYKITREVLGLTNLDEIDNLYIFPLSQQPINFYYTEPNPRTKLYTQKLLQQKLSENSDEAIWTAFDQKPFQISVFLPIHDEGEKLGLLRISVNESFFSSILNEVKLGKTGTVYLVHDQISLYAKNNRLVHGALPDLEESRGTAVKVPLSSVGWSLIGIVPKKEIVDQINQFNHIFLLMVILILAAVLVFALGTARLILRPLKKIVKGMESIQRGNLDVMLDHNHNDEFSMIIRNFNDMVERINALIETVYLQQVNYRKAEMQSLQAKLNPHFLYNTLDMMYWMLIMKDEEEIGSVVVALSDILRYSISHKTEFVTIGEDLAQLENYLKIQKLRFEDKLHYTLQLQDEMLNLKIPKLLIQPLVENAIKYAFREMLHGGVLHIRGCVEGDDLTFEVTDNGVGMPAEVLQNIRASLERHSNETGIGIQLVHQRAKYIYGEGCGLTIESAPGKGTKVTVKLRTKMEFNQEKL